MSKAQCTEFLKWALAQRGLHWPGFRKVQHQVCKRLKRRIKHLGLTDFAAYRALLQADPAEWTIFDECCHITISRFFRDRSIFEVLRRRVLPQIAARARSEARPARIWSAGCACGEEAYSLKILWDLEVASSLGEDSSRVLATDIDRNVLSRARQARFAASSLRELPPPLLEQAFDRTPSCFALKPRHRRNIAFVYQDLRAELPGSTFDLILCRYVAFTYFTPPLQIQVFRAMVDRLLPGGFLAIGRHERLPDNGCGLSMLNGAPEIFVKTAGPQRLNGM